MGSDHIDDSMDTTRCGCQVQQIEPKKAPRGRVNASIRLVIAGMGCPNCARRVRNALVSEEGVGDATVKLIPPVSHVLYDADRVTKERLIAAVGRAGVGTHHQYRASLPQ